MRFIASPIYRAFPELDGFTDEQCRNYLRQVYGGAQVRVAMWLVCPVLGVGGAMAVAWICAAIAHPSRGVTSTFAIVGILAAVFASFGFGTLIARDVLLGLLVLRALGGTARCPSCDYSAMGLLVPADFMVTCPECGQSINITAYRDQCVAGADGALRFMPPRGLAFERPRTWTPRRQQAIVRSVRRIGLAIVLTLGLVVVSVVALALAQSWSARADRAALPTPEQLDAALRPAGTAPSTGSIAAPLSEFALWDTSQSQFLLTRAGDRMQISARTRWGDASFRELRAMESVLQALDAMGLHQAGAMALAADRIAAGPGGSMLPSPVDTPYGKDWLRYAAVPRLWQLANAALAVAAARRDAPAFARAMEWQLAALRISASTPPFLFDYDELRPLVRVTAEALRADGGEQLASALDAAIRRQSVRPSMQAMKAARLDWEIDGLASWFENPWGALGPAWSGPRNEWIAKNLNIHWAGLYWPQRQAILEHSGVLFEELMADPSDRDQQKVSAAMAALDDAGPINWVRLQRFTGASPSVELRGALFERALATVVAIERFRRAEGHLPASLAELRPPFVDELPKDPYRQGPFGYRVLPPDTATAWHPGYTLWSVGVNGSDDGGSWRSDVVLVPRPPSPETSAVPSADSPAAPDATRGN